MGRGLAMIALPQIKAAAERLHGHAVVTPLLNAPFLDRIAGRRVLVKAECLQRTGSFKYRGARAALTNLPIETKGVLAFSSGNHAQGVALAACELGLTAVILMPSDAPLVKIDNTRAYGAEVILYDRATQDRDVLGADLCRARSLHLVRPYDDPDIIAGQGTVGLEIATQTLALGITAGDMIVCCGGGGLSSGVGIALSALAPKLRLHTAEPAGFDDMARSLNAGRILRNAAMTGSVCDAILTPEPGRITFPILQELGTRGLVVSDDQALRAVALAFQHLRIVLEPGGAVALAAALFTDDLSDTVICTASGGNVDPALFCDTLTRFAA
jgi:threonine dehydratase